MSFAPSESFRILLCSWNFAALGVEVHAEVLNRLLDIMLGRFQVDAFVGNGVGPFEVGVTVSDPRDVGRF